MSTTTRTYSYRNIWRVAYPILISLVMEQMIGLTDTAFLGRVGEIELGASAIAIVYYMVLFMTGFGFSLGAQIIIGRRNGEGRFAETGKVFWNGIYFLLGLSDVLTGTLRGMGQSLLPMAISVLGICGVRIVWIYTVFPPKRSFLPSLRCLKKSRRAQEKPGWAVIDREMCFEISSSVQKTNDGRL